MDVQRTKLAEAAQRAYSNLNSKGQELDGFEIIKNVLAGSMDADIFVQHWENLEKALAGSDAEQKQDLFFKTWLISRDPHSASAAKKVDKQFFHLLSMETIGAGQDTLIEMIEDAHRYTQHSLGKSQQKDVDGLFWLNQPSFTRVCQKLITILGAHNLPRVHLSDYKADYLTKPAS